LVHLTGNERDQLAYYNIVTLILIIRY